MNWRWVPFSIIAGFGFGLAMIGGAPLVVLGAAIIIAAYVVTS